MSSPDLNQIQASYTANANHTHRVGDALETAGRFVSAPAAKMISNGLRTFRKLEPGVHGQAMDRMQEVKNRVVYASKTLFYFILCCTGIPLIGAGMRWAATRFFRKTAVWIKPEGPNSNAQKISSAARQALPMKVGVCTFNVGAMASFIADNNGLEQMDTRAAKIAAQITAMKDDDVICLQEGFEGFDEVAKQLKEKNPDLHIVYDVGRSAFSIGSGLVLISKHPVTHFQFWEHPHVGGMEVFASKGVLAATIELPNGKPMIVINTHLNGGAAPAEGFPNGGKSYRSDQLAHVEQRASEYVEAFKQTYPSREPVVVFTGDYNIGPTKPSGKNGAEPAIDGEWFYDEALQEKGASHLATLMSKDDYDRITTQQVDLIDPDALKQETLIDYIDENADPTEILNIPNKFDQTVEKIKDVVTPKRLDQERGVHYSSFNMKLPGAGFDGHPENWVIKAELVDHIFQPNEKVLSGIAKAKFISENLDLAGGVSDHTAHHVNFEI